MWNRRLCLAYRGLRLFFIKVSEEHRKLEKEKQLTSLQLTADTRQEGTRMCQRAQGTGVGHLLWHTRCVYVGGRGDTWELV